MGIEGLIVVLILLKYLIPLAGLPGPLARW